MGIIILAEYNADQVAVLINNRKSIKLIVPDKIISHFEGGILSCGNKLISWSHKLRNKLRAIIARRTIVTRGNNTYELTARSAVICDRHGGVTSLLFKVKYLTKGHLWSKSGVRNNKACLVALNLANHLSLIFSGLRAINKGNAALLGQSNCQTRTRN